MAMTERVIEKLIQRQLNQWSRFQELLRTAEPEELPPRPIVTISRQRGSGGRYLARALARRLDLQIHDQDIVEYIARNEKIARDVVAQLDAGATSQIDLWIKGVLNRRIYLRDEFQEQLVRAIRALAMHGGVVILGRGGNFILDDHADLRVRMVASDETRIRALMAETDCSEGEAAERVAASDEARAGFIRKLYHADIDDPRNYDLVLNTTGMDRERLPELAMLALEARGAFASEQGR